MSEKTNTLIGGMSVLVVAGVISKVIGLFFRIPLANLIGAAGMGIYSAVYNIYNLLVAISTAGIPVAISRLVAEGVTLGRPREVRATVRVALRLLALIGAVLTVLLLLLARPYAASTGDPATAPGYMAIAPSILLVSVMSAFRGYMQGRRQMQPTAISQLIEQLAKVAISYPLAMFAMHRWGVVYAAAAALLGITIGEGIATAYMMVVYLRRRPVLIREEAQDALPPSSGGVLARRIITIALPMIIGAMVVPIASAVDVSMLRLRLQAAGFSVEASRSLYGLYTGYVISLINVPTGMAMAICIGLVPAISSARAQGRREDMHESSRMGFRMASLIGMPCAVGMSMLAEPIIRLLFSSLLPGEPEIAGRILSISAWTIVLFIHVQASTGILQGAGMQKVPMLSLLLGVVCKIVLNYVLVGQPGINIYGAPIGSLVSYAVSMAINTVWVVKKTGMRYDWNSILVRPGIATAGMAVAVYLAMQVLDMTRRHNTIFAVLAGMVVYMALVLLVGALRREDVEQIPGGRKLERALVKLRIWR